MAALESQRRFWKASRNQYGLDVFYPPVPLWGLTVGWCEASYLVFIFLHLVLGGWLAFRFSRKIGQSAEAALFFALAFIGNGYVLGFFSNPALLFPYLFWPLLAEGLWNLYQGRRAVTQLAIATILIETSGYPLTKILIFGSTALAALPLLSNWRKNLKPLIEAGVISLLCSAPEWASAIHALPLSERMGTDLYHEIAYGSPTNFLATATLFLPTPFLKRDTFQLGMVWLERSWWVGSLTLAVILAALRMGSLRFARYWKFALLALAGLLFSLGGHSFFRELSSLALPILEHLRYANMGRMIPMVFLIFLGAAAFDSLRAKDSDLTPDQESSARLRVSALWAVFAAATVAAAIQQQNSGIQSDALYFDPTTSWQMAGLHVGFYLLLAYSAYALRVRLSPKLGWPAIFVVLQFLSLADTGYAFRHLIARETQTPLETRVESFTVASPQPNERSMRAWFDGNDWIRWDGNLKVFAPYTPPYHRWMKPALQDPKTGRFAPTLVSCEDNGNELGTHPSISGQHSCTGTQFQIDRYFGNTIVIHGSSSSPAWIMVHDFVDPGWKATLNGEKAAIHTAFGYFKAIEVPAGQAWEIRLDYKAPFFPFLWFVSAFGFLLLGASAIRPRNKVSSF